MFLDNPKTALMITAWKVCKCGVISGPYFSVFEPEITPYLGTFHPVDELRTDDKYKLSTRQRFPTIMKKVLKTF